MTRTSLLLATLLLCGTNLAGAAPPPGGPRFVEDDYPSALAEAKRSKRLLFVDAWAPWCHTCLSMRSYVFPDPSLARTSSRYVWLSVDTERAANAAFVAKYPLQAWPTLFVINPENDAAPILRWPGSATVAQLGTMLDAADQAAHGKGEAVAQRDKSAESLVVALQMAHDERGCAETAAREAGKLERGPSFVNVVATGIGCAASAPKESPWRAAALGKLLPLGEPALAVTAALADDRSGLYEVLEEQARESGDAAAARAYGARWLAFLEAEAAKAKGAEARAVFDAHRVEAAVAAGTPERALPPLIASERDLPHDYNPAARQTLIYKELKRYPEAIAASDRALKLAYGPRRLRLYEQRADLEEAMGNGKAARATVARALAEADQLPAALRPVGQIERLKRRAGGGSK